MYKTICWTVQLQGLANSNILYIQLNYLHTDLVVCRFFFLHHYMCQSVMRLEVHGAHTMV